MGESQSTRTVLTYENTVVGVFKSPKKAIRRLEAEGYTVISKKHNGDIVTFTPENTVRVFSYVVYQQGLLYRW